MIKRIYLLLIIVLMAFYSSAFAVDSIFNHTVKDRSGEGKFSYHCEMVIDSIGSGDINYSQYFYVPPTQSGYNYFRSVASEVGTEDFDIYLEWISDPTTATAKAVTGTKLKDAQGTTAVADTANVIAGAVEIPSKIYGWARWKVVNDQAITASCTVTLDIGGDLQFGIDYSDLPDPIDSGD